MTRQLAYRVVVFTLASLSFACLLGHFYGLWTMQLFACTALPGAIVALVWIALATRRWPQGATSPYTWIVEGTAGGIVAALAYDLYRLPFVLNGAPLFKVFPQFGAMILGEEAPRWLVHTVGWIYHFSNGASLGIMFLALLPWPTPRKLFWGAILWAMAVEILLLLTPYASFFGLTENGWFLFLTASAHLVFGATLGIYCWRRVSHRGPAGSIASVG